MARARRLQLRGQPRNCTAFPLGPEPCGAGTVAGAMLCPGRGRGQSIVPPHEPDPEEAPSGMRESAQTIDEQWNLSRRSPSVNLHQDFGPRCEALAPDLGARRGRDRIRGRRWVRFGPNPSGSCLGKRPHPVCDCAGAGYCACSRASSVPEREREGMRQGPGPETAAAPATVSGESAPSATGEIREGGAGRRPASQETCRRRPEASALGWRAGG
jgi:hypothetical protein